MPRWLALLAVMTCGAAVTGTAVAQAISVPRIVFSDRTLANGMRLLMVEDHRTPTVAIDVGYRVGGKDDPAGRSGFAHLFEHLMFKGTRDLAPEAMDRLTEDVGGLNNAYTAEDITNYYEVVPSNYLQTILWAEAERMSSLVVDEANFTTERKVVIGEYDQRILATPYGMLGQLIDAQAYKQHPYKRGVIGNPEQLNAASLEDVRRFYGTFYRPDNAVLVIVGDFDPAQAAGWVDRYFGRIPRPASAIPRVTEVEQGQQEERRLTHMATNISLPAVAIAYHTVAANARDAATLDIIETLLGRGQSSRFYQSLVYKRQAATFARANSDTRAQPGLFVASAVAAGTTTAGALEQFLSGEIEQLKASLVPAAEMDKAKTQAITAIVRSRQTHDGIAQALVRAAVVRDDPNAINTDVTKYNAVTSADVQRVAQTYFNASNRIVIYYLPAAAK